MKVYVNQEFYKKHGNLLLTDKQINVLKKYNIDYMQFKSVSDLIYYLEYYLNNQQLNDLELVSEELSELQYYNYTNK